MKVLVDNGKIYVDGNLIDYTSPLMDDSKNKDRYLISVITRYLNEKMPEYRFVLNQSSFVYLISLNGEGVRDWHYSRIGIYKDDLLVATIVTDTIIHNDKIGLYETVLYDDLDKASLTTESVGEYIGSFYNEACELIDWHNAKQMKLIGKLENNSIEV